MSVWFSYTLRFWVSSFEVGNGGSERGFFGARDWKLGAVVPEVLELTERAIPQSDRSAPENRSHTMPTHRCQSSLSRNGAFLEFLFVFICSVAEKI